MYAVERLSSYISRGVYTVSGPFHPFGGAVDIIVVEQPDGSFKSSPWYVRFGKFQGVLKTKEKVVSVSINGVEAGFNMYLDHKGEAYFLNEEDLAEEGDPSVDDIEDLSHWPMKSQSLNFESGRHVLVKNIGANNAKIMARTTSRRSRIFGFVFGQRPIREDVEEPGRRSSLEHAEIAAELLEMKWSTNLGSDRIILNQEQNEVNNENKNSSDDDLFLMENDIPTYSSTIGTLYISSDSSPELHDHSEALNISEVCSSTESNHMNDLNEQVENYRVSTKEMRSSSVNIPGGLKSFGHEHYLIARSLPDLWRSGDSVVPSESIQLSRSQSCPGSLNPALVTQESLKVLKSDASRECNLRQGNMVEDCETLEIFASKPSFSHCRSWRIWPFRGSKTAKSVLDTTVESNNIDTEIASESNVGLDGVEDVYKIKHTKRKFRTITPTSQQIGSLNLMEGRNVISFTFSTSVLGQQQVDAQIYLWKWNSRIVISDVDGTITKSDVLGQFMPLVGVDWTQTGVTHLFSAIKENGYHLLFLSARAISQAYRTRQYLFNIKQDGKALPDGPVVISPDGFFPSLFREVIRRAPHEFKIACLEGIKALYPLDYSPFYAGFGNRDTDELSYLKVGIPKGKIFIINPKGQVAVNRLLNTKSYTSLHALVNGMFPPMPSHEKEDFNSWNYWKLPPPDIDI